MSSVCSLSICTLFLFRLTSAQWGMPPQQPFNIPYPQQNPQMNTGYGQRDPYSAYLPSPYSNPQMAAAPLYRPNMGLPLGSQPQFGASNNFGQIPGYGMNQNTPMQQGGSSPFGVPMTGGQFQNDDMQRQVDVEAPPPNAAPTRIIPPFMKGATNEEMDKFYSIVQNPSWSPAIKQAKVEEFVRSLNVDAQNLYSEFDRSSASSTSAKRQKVHQIVNGMSQEAQIQFQKVSAVMTNPSLSNQERLEKAEEIYGKIPADVKKEFDQKLVDL